MLGVTFIQSFELENYLDLTKFELSNLDFRNNYYNFTKEQQLGLRSLKNMQDIIFSKSDKGGAIVISKKTHYIKEGLRQLNSIHYTEIQEPNLLLIKNNIQTQISKMFDNGEIDGITLDFLRGSSKEGPRLGRLFLLPKLHKLSELVIQGIKKQTMTVNELPPCRPIISQCNSVTEIKRQNSYIRDSGDFINKIENLRPDRDCLLVSFDCTSMYTNMEFNELIHSVGRAYNSAVKEDYPIKLPSCETIKSLVATVLKNNYFEFNDRYFVQKIGASHLKQRGYKDHEIRRNCESALNIERPELLRFKQESDKQIPLVFVTKYHFSLGNINKALRKHYKKLVRNAKCRELFPKPPMVAYSRHRNLKEILTRSVVKA
ncbi:unnamed protein product [Mytilus edulis]|uniref:Reverse transcriptase domain-containing protein n=1 Tax=Mytilus edulis TaxID=6550 RepID=A0A8S3T3J6_MYTED|nr:unnamed protein product [Mytilus edulis]